MAESVESLVERLENATLEAKQAYNGARERQGVDWRFRHLISAAEEATKALREAASRLAEGTRDPLREFCQSEGPYGETICMMKLGHKGQCGWERTRRK